MHKILTPQEYPISIFSLGSVAIDLQLPLVIIENYLLAGLIPESVPELNGISGSRDSKHGLWSFEQSLYMCYWYRNLCLWFSRIYFEIICDF